MPGVLVRELPPGGLREGPWQANMRRGEGGGSGTPKFVYQTWPNQILPIISFVFPHNHHFGLGGGGVLVWLSAVLM